MRRKLLDPATMPNPPSSQGKVLVGAERLEFLKEIAKNSDFRSTAEKEVEEARRAAVTDDQVKQIVQYINDAYSRVSAHEIGVRFGIPPLRVAQLLQRLDREGTVKRLRTAFMSRACWDALDEDRRFQELQQ